MRGRLLPPLLTTYTMKSFQKFFSAFLIGSLALSSCDDGNITDEAQLTIDKGYAVRMTGTLTNMDQWNDSKYQIVIAAFAAQDSYPLLAKNVPIKEGEQDYLFEGINPECQTIELCVLNLINKKVASIETIFDKAEDANRSLDDTIFYHPDNVDVGMFSCIQNSIFTKTCAFCHGKGESAAASLYLTEDKSYENLVNTSSSKIDSLKRVDPYNAEKSMLYKVLTEYSDSCGWHYNHTNFFYGNSTSNLVKEWINSGALH